MQYRHRRDQKAALKAAGFGTATEWLCRLDGYRRHLERVAEVQALANDAKGMGLLALDLNGVNGIGGTGHHGRSARLAPFDGLGTGRWQALDGEAWLAASQEALGKGAAVAPFRLLPGEESLRVQWGTDEAEIRPDDEERREFLAAFARRVLWSRAHKAGLVSEPPPEDGVERYAASTTEEWVSLLESLGGGNRRCP